MRGNNRIPRSAGKSELNRSKFPDRLDPYRTLQFYNEQSCSLASGRDSDEICDLGFRIYDFAKVGKILNPQSKIINSLGL